MAINRTPVLKRCRQLGLDPVVLGYSSSKTSKREPKRRRKESEYAMQLREKQKVKFIYGVLEKQFHKYYLKASHMKGITGDNMLQLLELRLDNVVYRLGLGKTRRMARQVVTHGHILVNGRKVDIPSYTVKAGDVITIRQQSAQLEMFKVLREGTSVVTPKWLTFDAPTLTGKVEALPQRDDIDFELQENLIVEFYSR